MSGYLHRVIAAARNPGGSIHPLLGSLFSPVPAPRIADWRGEYDVADRSAADRETSPRSAQFGAHRFDAERTTGAAEGIEAGRFSAPAREPPAATPLNARAFVATRESDEGVTYARRWAASAGTAGPEVVPAEGAASEGAAAEGAARHRVASEALAPIWPGIPTTRESDGGPSRSADAAGRVEPLIAVDRTGAAVAIASHRPSTSAATHLDAPSAARHGVNRSGQSLRESEDIQIHIGRIEVMAVAPAMRPPPLAPRQTSPSLDDYLKRRGGRPA
jgi:hypothetical protein